MSIERSLDGLRYVETLRGDTIQRLAERELGDATRWTEIVWINNLLPPFITDDHRRASDRVLLSGGLLLVPSNQEFVGLDVSLDSVFESDCKLTSGLLSEDSNGDFLIVAGRENLRQQIVNRINTELGEILFHPDYGCDARKLVGAVNGPTAALLAAEYVKQAISSDTRVQEVVKCTGVVDGDSVRVDASFTPVVGRPIDITQVI